MIPKIDLTTSKPSAVLFAALNDLEALENTPGYEIHMGVWHDKILCSDTCQACFAGAVMARVTGYDPDQRLLPDQFGDTMYSIFSALDSIRDCSKSEVRDGLEVLFNALNDDDNQVDKLIDDAAELYDWVEYDDTAPVFKHQRRELAAFLHHAGH